MLKELLVDSNRRLTDEEWEQLRADVALTYMGKFDRTLSESEIDKAVVILIGNVFLPHGRTSFDADDIQEAIEL
jgi:hypothetical protein